MNSISRNKWLRFLLQFIKNFVGNQLSLPNLEKSKHQGLTTTLNIGKSYLVSFPSYIQLILCIYFLFLKSYNRWTTWSGLSLVTFKVTGYNKSFKFQRHALFQFNSMQSNNYWLAIKTLFHLCIIKTNVFRQSFVQLSTTVGRFAVSNLRCVRKNEHRNSK